MAKAKETKTAAKRPPLQAKRPTRPAPDTPSLRPADGNASGNTSAKYSPRRPRAPKPQWPAIPPGGPGAYALVGMGTLFAGIIRAPMTSVFMIFELTQDYQIIVPLMVANKLRIKSINGLS